MTIRYEDIHSQLIAVGYVEESNDFGDTSFVLRSFAGDVKAIVKVSVDRRIVQQDIPWGDRLEYTFTQVMQDCVL